MKESPDDIELQRYLRREDDLSVVYAGLRAAMPGAAIDKAVLDLAHGALEQTARRRGPWRSRWPTLAALAATVVLCVGLVLRLVMENDPLLRGPAVIEAPDATPQTSEGDTSPVLDDPDRPVSRASAPQAPAVTPEWHASRADESLTSGPQPAPAAKRTAAPAAAAAPSRAPAGWSASPTKQSNDTGALNRQETGKDTRKQTAESVAESTATPSGESRDKARSGGRFEAMRTMQESKDVADAPAADVIPPEEWLARIEQLRHAGRNEEADRELELFNARYPEYFQTRSEGPTR